MVVGMSMEHLIMITCMLQIAEDIKRFGDTKEDGITKVYLNGIPIALAHTNLQSKVISFEYKRGDVLKITEEKTGIMKINSFKLEDCKKEGNIAF